MAFQLIGPVPDSLHARGLIGSPLDGVHGKKPVEGSYEGEELDGEMVLMAGLTGAQVDAALKAIRKSGIGPIPYKAVLTAANQEWDVLKLYQEIKSEHQKMSENG